MHRFNAQGNQGDQVNQQPQPQIIQEAPIIQGIPEETHNEVL